MSNTSAFECVICNHLINGQYGNNAQPVANGQCCDQCNCCNVMPARLQDMRRGLSPAEFAEQNIQQDLNADTAPFPEHDVPSQAAASSQSALTHPEPDEHGPSMPLSDSDEDLDMDGRS